MHPSDRPIPDTDWMQAATDHAEDGAIYQSLSDRYTVYSGPLTWPQYVQAAEQEREAIDQADDHDDRGRHHGAHVQHEDVADDAWF